MTAGSEVDRTLAALSDPTRRAVIDLLLRKPHRAGEIADALRMSGPAVSRHLRILRRQGLITDDEPDDDARVRLYRLCPEAFASLRGWLDEVEVFWSAQLRSLQKHAGRRAAQRKR
jgi:DNA-binding transcriptional ArsR family regulator